MYLESLNYISTNMEVGSLYDSVKPVLIATLAIAVYTLISNFLFGHQTFWKPSHVITSIKKNYSGGSLPPISTSIVVAKRLELLNDDSIFHCFSYLTATELHCVSKVSKRFLGLSSYPVLWSDLLDMAYFNPVPLMKPIVTTQFLHVLSKKELFYILRAEFGKLYLDQLTRDDSDEPVPNSSLFVILHGDVLDLSTFAREHPGGEHILRDVHGTDATRIFELANHSDLAIELSKNFIVWSGKLVIGS